MKEPRDYWEHKQKIKKADCHHLVFMVIKLQGNNYRYTKYVSKCLISNCQYLGKYSYSEESAIENFLNV